MITAEPVRYTDWIYYQLQLYIVFAIIYERVEEGGVGCKEVASLCVPIFRLKRVSLDHMTGREGEGKRYRFIFINTPHKLLLCTFFSNSIYFFDIFSTTISASSYLSPAVGGASPSSDCSCEMCCTNCMECVKCFWESLCCCLEKPEECNECLETLRCCVDILLCN